MVMIGTSSSSDMATIIIAVSGAKSRKMVDSTTTNMMSMVSAMR